MKAFHKQILVFYPYELPGRGKEFRTHYQNFHFIFHSLNSQNKGNKIVKVETRKVDVNAQESFRCLYRLLGKDEGNRNIVSYNNIFYLSIVHLLSF